MSPKPVFVPLAAGLQTELADQLVSPGSTLLSENMYCPQTGKAFVRFGADVLSTDAQATIPSGGTLPVPWQLATLGGQLVRFNRAPVPFHTWADEPDAWVVPANEGGIESYRKGPIKLDTAPVFAGSAQVRNVDIAVGTDSIVCVYRIDTGFIGTSGIVVAILDRQTRRPIFVQRRACDALFGARVVIVGQRAVVAYENSGSLQVVSYNLTTYTQAQTQTMGAVLNETAIDMRAGSPVAGANNVGILYRTTASGELRLATVDATNLATNSTNTPRTTASAVVVPDLCFGWMRDLGASAKFAIMIDDTTNGLRTLWDMPAPAGGFTNATATHVLDAAATAGVRNLIGTTINATSTGVYRVLYEVENAAPMIIKVAVWSGAASTGTQFRGVGIRSKFWAHSTNFYFLAAFDAADQNSYFVLAVAGDTTLTSTTFSAPLAVSHPRDGAGITESTNAMSSAVVGSDGAIYVGVTQETRTDSIASSGTATGGTQTLLGVDVIRVRHPVTPETELGRPAEYLRSLFVPGGGLGFFDGTTYAMAGFAYYPTGASAVSQAGGNLTPSAAYSYRFLFRFIDKNGRTWRSAPSTPLQVSTTGANFKFQLTTDTLRLVDRGLATGHNGYSIEVYRTQANSTEGYFQVATIDNDPTVDTAVVVDNVADASLGEQLYTDGNGLENQLLPSIAWCVEFQGRLVCGEQGTGTLWYSLEADFTSGLLFNEALTLDVGDPSEPTTGGAVFGEQLYVFKAGQVYLIGGQGANALGQGATYTFRKLDDGVGCSNPQSIAVADDGVWFRSAATRAGIHRTGGGRAEYVGQGVHAYDDLTITGTAVVNDKTEIRFYTVEGRTLIWNWTTRQWGTNTDQPCLTAATGYGSGVVYARETDNYILSEATDESLVPYEEGGAAYTGKIRSPWYQAGGLAGWGRVRRIQGVGDGGDPHTTTIRLYKDLSETAFQEGSIEFDGTRDRWDWEMRPAQQKASAQMIEAEIGPPAAINIAADADDEYDGVGGWFFENAAFTSEHVGGTITLGNTRDGDYNGTYTITEVVSATEVTMIPVNGSGANTIGTGTSHTIVLQPPMTAGPGIVGVSLIPIAKDGMDKLGSARRVT